MTQVSDNTNYSTLLKRCLWAVRSIFSRSYCYTVWSAIGIILLSVHLSVCDTVYCGSQGWCTRLKVAPACSYSTHVPICPFRHFCCRMYRLATKCTTKKRSERCHKCLVILMDSGLAYESNTHGSFVNNDTLACRTLQLNGHSMHSRGVRTADASACGRRSAVIVGSADWQRTDFFIQRSRCCDLNEYRVKYCMQYDRLSQQQLSFLLCFSISFFCSFNSMGCFAWFK